MKIIKLYLLLNLPIAFLVITSALVLFLANLPGVSFSLKIISVVGLIIASAAVFSFPKTARYQILTSEYYEATGKNW